MLTHISINIILLLMLYAMGATVSAVACVYLLFRRGNAFAPQLTTPKRLRRWTAAFFGIAALGHFWYLPADIVADSQAATLWMLIGALLDCLLTIPLAIIVLLCMLQDRRRPLWPVGVTMAPIVAGVVACIVTRSYALLPWLRGYFLLAGIGFAVYTVRAVRQYGHWLRDNYADLEHKEVWQSFVAMAAILLMFGYYVSGDSGMAYECIIQVGCIALVCFLLWRVETLQTLETKTLPQPLPVRERQRVLAGASEQVRAGEQSSGMGPGEGLEGPGVALETLDDIELLLRERCIDTQLYLQHGLTLSQLAQELGTNRTYLSLFFSRQNTNYNLYINDLRILYFVRIYSEAVAAGRDITAQELAAQSGYRSYSTFSHAFKQRMGKSVKEWMSEEGQ